jgi:hypothetical protein
MTIGRNGMNRRSTIKNDLFAPQQREGQIDHLGDPLAGLMPALTSRR